MSWLSNTLISAYKATTSEGFKDAVRDAVLPKYGDYVGPKWSAGKTDATLHEMVTGTPVDVLDAIAKEHDIAYVAAKEIADIHRADERFIQQIDEAKQSGLFTSYKEKMAAAAARTAMSTKTTAEQAANTAFYGYEPQTDPIDRDRASAYLNTMNVKGGVVKEYVRQKHQQTKYIRHGFA